MYTPVSLQELDNARQDVESLEKVVNGNENEDVTTRLGGQYPTLSKFIKDSETLVQSSIDAVVDGNMITDELISVGGGETQADKNAEFELTKFDAGITATAKFGGVSRNLASKLSDLVSVKDFGAKGDGVTDDTEAIRKALGKNVFFPKGTYILSSRLTLESNTHWTGATDAIIKSVEPFAIGGFLFYAPTRTNITIDNLSIDGAGTNPRGGFWFDGCRGVYIKNCKFLGVTNGTVGGVAVYLRGCFDAHITDNLLDGFLSGVQFDSGGSRIFIRKNKIVNCGHICIRAVESTLYPSSVVIDGNILYGTGHKGSLIYMGAAQNSALTGRFVNVQVINNTAIGNYSSFMMSDGSADLFSLRGIRGLRVSGNRIEGGGDLGLVVEYSEEFTVSGNDVRENEISGIVIHNSRRGTVTGNICINNCADRGGQATKDAVRAGIRLMAGSKDVVVTGNTCTDSRDLNIQKTQLYGVAVIDSGTSGVEVTGNFLNGNKWGTTYVENLGSTDLPTPITALNITSIPLQHYPQTTLFNFRNRVAGAPFNAICTNSQVNKLSVSALTSSTTLELENSGLPTVPAEGSIFLGVLLDNNTVHWSKINNITGNTVTLDLPLPSAAALGNPVKVIRFLVVTKFVS